MTVYASSESTLSIDRTSRVNLKKTTTTLNTTLVLACRTEVFGGDGLEADDLQSSSSQDQLAAPRVEVLRNHIGG